MKKIYICLLVLSVFFTNSLNAQDTPSEEYIIEKGDTLWDISDTRLRDSFLWPKLWNVNPQIENPDLIYPGSKIIIPSREELMRMPSPVRKIPLAREQKGEKTLAEPVFQFPPEKIQKYIVDKNRYILSGWIADKFPGIGKITYSSMERQMAGKNDIVYLTLNDQSMTEKRFFVIRDIKTVEHPVSGKIIGHQIRIPGIVEIIGKDNNMTKAVITDSFEDIQIGDGLLPYQELAPPLVSDTARTPDISGYIIESHTNIFLLSEGDIIFLDKGRNDGVEIGDVFSVFSEMPTERHIGKIQVVSLQPSTSGAVLLQSSQELTIGTKWGNK